MIRLLWTMLVTELRLANRDRGQWLLGVIFFVLVVSLFPLGTNPQPRLLAQVAPAVIWTAALTAALTGLDRLWRSDYEEGVLDQYRLASTPLALIAFIKALAHWLTTGLLMTLCAPLLAVMLGLPSQALWPLICGLLLGTPILSLMGSIAVALTLAVKKSGVLVPLLVLPLYAPVLIFGAGAASAAAVGGAYDVPLLMLGALLLLAATLTPLATAVALDAAGE